MMREAHLQGAGCDLVADVVRTTGSVNLKVTGQSMLPAILPGDLLTVRREPPQSLQPGQVVLFQRDQKLTAHRIVRVAGEEIVTRGDSVPTSDLPVPLSDVLGLVIAIQRNGRPVSLRFSFWKRAMAIAMRRSEWCTRLFLRLSCRLRRFEGDETTLEPVDPTAGRAGL
jgi:signal peptidase I